MSTSIATATASSTKVHQLVQHLLDLLSSFPSQKYEIRHCLRQLTTVLRSDTIRSSPLLIVLITQNDEYDDSMIEELMASVIIQSVDLLLVDKTEITVPLLQALLVKTMRLISESRRPERQDDLLEALLTLLNAYLKEDEDDGNGNDYNDKLRQILPDDDWLHHCLEILLVSLQSTATTAAAAAAAATTTTTTTTTTPTPSLQASILAFQFVQILLCSSGSKQVAFLPSIKDFCTALVESTLYLLEEGTNKGLYYAIVATNLVLLLMESKTHHHHQQQQQQQQQQSNDGKYYYQGMAKSLWQASTDFVVQYLEQDTNNIPQEYQAIATETLWKLASTITSSTSFESTNYEEWMAVTMLRLLQQPNSTVSPQVQEWIQLQLANNPTARHALQATAISMISSFSIRHCDDPSPMLSLLFVSSTQQENNDPWQSLAQEYLSDHLMTIGHE